MNVYLAGPITHARHPDAASWRIKLTDDLAMMYGITCWSPVEASKYTAEYGIHDPGPVLTQRDKWFCEKADVVLANFEHSEKPSIGTCIELGWADEAGTPIVAAIPDGNVHEHPIVLNVVKFRTRTLNEAARVVLGLAGV